MIEFELETLPSAQLFELCAAHLERGEYWAEFNRRYNQILIRSVYYGYRRFAQAEPPNRWVVKELVQDVYAKLLKDDCLTLRRFRGHTEAEAQVYLSQAAVNVTADHLRHTHALKRYAEMVSIEDLLRERKEDEVVAKADDYTDRLAQEELIRASSIAFSIVHATQFFEFITSIADASTDNGVVRVPPVLFQPMAADDVAAGVGRVAVGRPVTGIVEIGGPEQFRFDEPVRRVLTAANDPRDVVTDANAGYFGIMVTERTLVPGDGVRLGEVRLDDWLRQSASVKTAVR